MRNISVPVVEGPVDMTSGFRTAARPDHRGVDLFPVPRGGNPAVLAFGDGHVLLSSRGNPTAGNWVEIAHAGGRVSTYMHLDTIRPGIVPGLKVEKGERIGYMGDTGNAPGSHLHFELRETGAKDGGGNAVDPMPFLLNRNPSATGGNMNISRRPSPNHAAGRQGHAPDIIVCHITNGNFPGSVEWVTNPASQVSYHFMVSLAGEITQCVDIADTAWANGTSVTAGDSRHSRNSTLAIVQGRGGNANSYSISIGFEGVHSKTNGRLAPAQVDAAVRLIEHIRCEVSRNFGVNIPTARTHIVGHFEITPLTRPNCPGAGFQFDEIIRASNDGAAHAPTTAPPHTSGPPFRVRVGNFADRGQAVKTRDELAKSGHGDAFLVQCGDKWRVQVASGPNLGAAKELAETLRAQGFGDVAVM